MLLYIYLFIFFALLLFYSVREEGNQGLKYLQMTAITNVIEGSMLLMAQEKVGDVIFSPT